MTDGPAQRLKTAFDFLAALACLVAAAPLLLLSALLVRVSGPGPVIYRQERVGLRGKRFVFLKFRTMREDADEILVRQLAASSELTAEWKQFRRLRHDPRVIPVVGTWLRQLSLDELPQLVNVLRGEMSLVGPRPLEVEVADALPRDLRELRERVRPGITGLWQVSGRSEMDIATLARVDADYVNSWSLWRDVVILCRTPGAVLSRRGAY